MPKRTKKQKKYKKKSAQKKSRTKLKIKSKKLKILAAGDIHGDTGLIKKLAEKAKKENVDIVILAGDLTFGNEPVKGLLYPFEKQKKQVLLIPGNHEPVATTKFLSEIYPNVKDIHGYSIKFKNKERDVGIFGAGSANVGIFQLNEKKIYDLLERGFEKIKDSKKKIMVTHVHPSGSIIEKFTDFFKGSSGVERAIKKFQPDIALCSHVHEAAGIEEKIGNTKVINVGRKGKIIEV